MLDTRTDQWVDAQANLIQGEDRHERIRRQLEEFDIAFSNRAGNQQG